MANCAEKYQDEIGEIFDDFLSLMNTSAARVEVESLHCEGHCQVKLTLSKCRFCEKPLFTTFFTIRDPTNVKHLAKYLDSAQAIWKFYTHSDDSSG